MIARLTPDVDEGLYFIVKKTRNYNSSKSVVPSWQHFFRKFMPTILEIRMGQCEVQVKRYGSATNNLHSPDPPYQNGTMTKVDC